MQRAGHRPFALVGGGTGLIGDPSGKTEMRKLIKKEDVEINKAGIKKQLSNFIDFSDNKAVLVDNADWLTEIRYIDFLRDIGRYFSVNRMIKAESYKMRLDSDDGLSFIEFNYMLLQAYDFLKLAETQNCYLQMGGSDQWGNIVAGVDLIRRKLKQTAFGITFPLITTSNGAKMGKTAKGAVWLDPQRTSPYEYYQFWVNTDDADVVKFLKLFTFLPVEEIESVSSLDGADLNSAKAILAFETTRLAHGDEAAVSALASAMTMFGHREIPDTILPSSKIARGETIAAQDSVPSSVVSISDLNDGIPVFRLFFETAGLAASGGAARKLIAQGGAYINDKRVNAFDDIITAADFKEGALLLRAGKKRYHKLLLSDESGK
jgi:tyrosyl-tRNA synthetase